ncbi:hypothetical protein CVT24_001242 [Panaeolus cyanescens]|uniref:Ecp2 effector protein-like domain-containing protein n=1 Tax=Panaeolus cyanescens TaxID=181874 RepID=A0A409YYX8_9AGAR|nr:hypothetical protein CVT24_001242 [Panaeolus cyanescens]
MFKLTATALFVASVLVGTHAAPAAIDNRSPVETFETLVKRTNHCYDSSFENRWRASAPLVNDCRILASNIAGDGDWTQSTASGQRQIASFGTCHFGVEGAETLLVSYRVGNQDVIDLINDSINRFQQDGRVAARGVMPCDQITPGTVRILWGIYE